MARKKRRRFAEGGELTEDEIVVRGRKSGPEFIEASQFDLSRLGGLGAGSFGGSMDMGGPTGGGQRITQTPMPVMPRSGMRVAPAIVRSQRSELADIMGDKAPRGYGLKFSRDFAKGGKADGEPTGGKKRSKAKRYATGGKVSSASKRADGCATKGKTKGRMV